MKAVLAELKPYDPVTGTRRTIRLCNANDARVTLISGGPGEFLPLIATGPVISRAIFNGDFTGKGEAPESELGIALDEKVCADWLGLVWGDADVTIWTGKIGDPFSSFVKRWTVAASGIERQRGSLATIRLRPPVRLNRPVLYLSFAGTDDGDAGDTGEGRAEVRGVLKPFLFGNARYVRPVLLDAARQIYCYHGYGATGGATEAFEGGLSKGAPDFTWASYAAMRDAVLTQDQWGHCPSLGMVRNGGQAQFPFTIHAGGCFSGDVKTRIADAILFLLAPTGVSYNAASYSALFAARTEAIDFYLSEQVTVEDVLTELMLGANGYWMENSAGELLTGLLAPGITGSPEWRLVGNLLPSADDLANGAVWIRTGVTAPTLVNGYWRITDASANYHYLSQSMAVAAGTNYTFITCVRKDSVAKTTRSILFYLDLAPDDPATAIQISIDTSTGEHVFEKFGTHTTAPNYSVVDGGDCWIVSLFIYTKAADELRLYIYPAVGSSATLGSAGHSAAAQGSIDLKRLQLLSGGDYTTYPAAYDRVLDLDGKASPICAAATEEETSAPAYRLRLGGVATHYPHAANDVVASIAATDAIANAATRTYPPSSTPPVSPAPTEGDQWPDTSGALTIMRRYDAATTTWVRIATAGANFLDDLVNIPSSLIVNGGPVAGLTVRGDRIDKVSGATWAPSVYTSEKYVAPSVGCRISVNTLVGITTNPLLNEGTSAYHSIYGIHRSIADWVVYDLGASIASFGSSRNGVTFSDSTYWSFHDDGVLSVIKADGVVMWERPSQGAGIAYHGEFVIFYTAPVGQSWVKDIRFSSGPNANFDSISGANKPAPLASSGRNLVINGNGELQTLEGWKVGAYSGAPAALILTDTQVHTGLRSFWLAKSVTGEQISAQTKAMPIIPGRSYRLKFWALAGGTGAGSAGAFYTRLYSGNTRDHLGFLTSAPTSVDPFSSIVVPAAWTAYEYLFVPPVGYSWTAIEFINYIGGPTNIYVDEVELVELTDFALDIGGSDKPELGADVTSGINGSALILIDCDHLGAPLESAIPASGGRSDNFKLTRNGVLIPSGVTWTRTVKSGTITNSISGTGAAVLNTTALGSLKAVVEVKAVVGTRERLWEVTFEKKLADPPSTGGGGGATTQSDTSFPTINSTTHAVISDELTIVDGGDGNFSLSASLGFYGPNTGFYGYYIYLKWQYWNGSAWADVSGGEQLSSEQAIRYIDGEGFTWHEPGFATCTRTHAGTASSTVKFRLLARLDTGTRTTSFSGTATAAG